MSPGACLDWPALMPDVARVLLGEPNTQMSNARELRYGAKGSLAVYIAGQRAGSWRDYEAEQRGGVLALVKRVRGCTTPEAIDWLRARGLLSGAARAPARAATGRSSPAPAESGPGRVLAGQLWTAAGPVADTPGSLYLAARGECPTAVRWLPRASAPPPEPAVDWYGVPEWMAGCLVRPLRAPGDVDGPPAAVSLAGVGVDGAPKAWGVEGSGPRLIGPPPPEPDPRTVLAGRLWESAVVADDSPGRVYLAGRRAWPPVGTGPALPASVRWLPRTSAPPRDKAAQWRGLPPGAAGALVFAWRPPGDTNTETSPAAVKLVAVSGRGERIRWGGDAGAPVRPVGSARGLVFECGDPAGPQIAIVEGEADALATAMGWRAVGFEAQPDVRIGGGTGGLALETAADVARRPVVLLPDRDKDGGGAKKAGELAERLRSDGRDVEIRRRPPPAPGTRIDPRDPAAEVAWRWGLRATAHGGGERGAARAWRWMLTGDGGEHGDQP